MKPEGKMPLWFPRIGLTLTVSDALDQVKWYGRGPQENYPDRKTGYPTGIYASTVQAMYEPLSNATRLRIADRCTLAATDHGQRHRPSIQDERMVQLQHLSVQHRQSDESDVYLPIAEAERHDPESRLCTTGVGCTARGVFGAYKAMPQEYRRTISIRPMMK